MNRATSRSIALATLAASLFLTVTPVWAAHPTPVKVGKRIDLFASGTDAWFAWDERHPHTKGHFDAWAQRPGHKPFKLNTGTSIGYLGQIDPHGTEVAFQQVHKGHSDIHVMDLATRHFVPLPASINTSHWEWGPSLSDNRLLFVRIEGDRDILLEDPDITASPPEPLITIASYGRTSKGYSKMDSQTRSAGPWSTWSVWTGHAYDTFRFEEGVGIDSVPNPGHKRDDYSASVLDDGTVTLARSGPKCGQQVHLSSWDGGSDVATIRAVPHGIDLDDTAVWTDGTHSRLWYTTLQCHRPYDYDIFRLDDFLARTTAALRVGSSWHPTSRARLHRTPLLTAMSGPRR